MKRFTCYVSMSVRSHLTNASYPRDFCGMFKHPDGGSMTPEQAREALLDQLAAGRETIPLDPGCRNPCTRDGCAGFDYGADGGCPGVTTTEASRDGD